MDNWARGGSVCNIWWSIISAARTFWLKLKDGNGFSRCPRGMDLVLVRRMDAAVLWKPGARKNKDIDFTRKFSTKMWNNQIMKYSDKQTSFWHYIHKIHHWIYSLDYNSTRSSDLDIIFRSNEVKSIQTPFFLNMDAAKLKSGNINR